MRARVVRVQYPGLDESRDVDNPSVLVADHGSYALLGAERNTSAYHGICFLDRSDFRMVKALHDIRLRSPAKQVRLTARHATIERAAGEEELFFYDGLACYEARGDGPVDVWFDVRDVYDSTTEERGHDIALTGKDPWVLRVSARGHTYLLVSDKPITPCEEWEEHETPYDERRGGRAAWWVVRGAQVTVEDGVRLVVCPERREAQAVAMLQSGQPWAGEGRPFDTRMDVARQSMEGLVTHTPSGDAGVLAGLPWFFQIYTRDEAISTGGLLALGEYALAARILLHEVGALLPSGRIQNRFPVSETGSADGAGWAFLRLSELFDASRSALRDDQWAFVFSQLRTALSRILADRREGLVWSGPQETWMDTTGGTSDDRRGARIEIQALTLRMLSFCRRLAEHVGEDAERFVRAKEELSGRVREVFFDGAAGLLADGYGEDGLDRTVRPNAFLALYAYPDLLSHEEWVRIAKRSLERLRLSWGGLSSIAVDDDLFCAYHTGGDDRSYHRGDSWFFVNNLSAAALARLDGSFRSFAEQVFSASVEDLLWRGAAGHCSEISSAAGQEALGCWCQAWSASSLIELAAALGRL